MYYSYYHEEGLFLFMHFQWYVKINFVIFTFITSSICFIEIEIRINFDYNIWTKMRIGILMYTNLTRQL